MSVDPVARVAATPSILQIEGPTRKSGSSERQFAKATATAKADAAPVQDRTRIDIPDPRTAYEIQQEYRVRYGKHMEKDFAEYLASHEGSCGKTLIQVFDAAARYGFDELGLIDKMNTLWGQKYAGFDGRPPLEKWAVDKADDAFTTIVREADYAKVDTSYWGLGTDYFVRPSLQAVADAVCRLDTGLRTPSR